MYIYIYIYTYIYISGSSTYPPASFRACPELLTYADLEERGVGRGKGRTREEHVISADVCLFKSMCAAVLN